MEATWLETMADRPDRDRCGTLSLFKGHALSLSSSLLSSSDVTFQFSEDKKFIFAVLVLPLLLSWCLPDAFVFLENQDTAWFLYDPHPLASSSVCFQREREKERE